MLNQRRLIPRSHLLGPVSVIVPGGSARSATDAWVWICSTHTLPIASQGSHAVPRRHPAVDTLRQQRDPAVTRQRTREPDQAEEAEHEHARRSDDPSSDAAVGGKRSASQHEDGRSDRRSDKGAAFGGEHDANWPGGVTASARQRAVAGAGPRFPRRPPAAGIGEVEVHRAATAKNQHANEPDWLTSRSCKGAQRRQAPKERGAALDAGAVTAGP